MGDAGHTGFTGSVGEEVFPVFGSTHYTVRPVFMCRDLSSGETRVVDVPRCGENEERVVARQMFYEATVEGGGHQVSEGVPDRFAVNDTSFLVESRTGEGSYTQLSEGVYTAIYVNDQLDAPLVIVYRDNGTSVTFTGMNQVSVYPESPAYFQRFLQNPDLVRLVQNAVHYAYSESRYSENMERASRRLEEIETRKRELEESARKIQREKNRQRSIRLSIYSAVSLAIIAVITYLTILPSIRRKNDNANHQKDQDGRRDEGKTGNKSGLGG